MPRISGIDRTLDLDENPIRVFVSRYSDFRLQLKALPDLKDPQTGQIIKGAHQVAQFRHGMFETNIPEIIELVEKSYAFQNGDVEDHKELIQKAKDKRYGELLVLAQSDPELLDRLKKDLVKPVSKKAQAAAKEQIAGELESETRITKTIPGE